MSAEAVCSLSMQFSNNNHNNNHNNDKSNAGNNTDNAFQLMMS